MLNVMVTVSENGNFLFFPMRVISFTKFSFLHPEQETMLTFFISSKLFGTDTETLFSFRICGIYSLVFSHFLNISQVVLLTNILPQYTCSYFLLFCVIILLRIILEHSLFSIFSSYFGGSFFCGDLKQKHCW